MFVGLLEMDLFLPHSRSLKDKRQHVRSLTNQVAKKFNLSVAEAGYQDLWQRSLIGVACVSDEIHQTRTVLEHVTKWSAAKWEGEMLSSHIHIFSSKGDI